MIKTIRNSKKLQQHNKINLWDTHSYLHTSVQHSIENRVEVPEKEIKTTVPPTIASKIKYLRINHGHLYNVNYVIFLKEIKNDRPISAIPIKISITVLQK